MAARDVYNFSDNSDEDDFPGFEPEDIRPSSGGAVVHDFDSGDDSGSDLDISEDESDVESDNEDNDEIDEPDWKAGPYDDFSVPIFRESTSARFPGTSTLPQVVKRHITI